MKFLAPLFNRPTSAVLSIAAAVFITSTIGGFYLGRARSERYEDRYKTESQLQAFVTANARAERPFAFAKRIDTNGRVVELALSSANLVFVCGPRTFTYNSGTGAVTPAVTDPSAHLSIDAATIGRNAIDAEEFDKTLGFMIGGSEAYALSGTAMKFSALWKVSSREKHVQMAAYSVLAGASGFLLGFYLGYSDQPQCTANAFQEALKDQLFWQPLASSFARHHQWTFDYALGGTLPAVSNLSQGKLRIGHPPTVEPDFQKAPGGLFDRPPGWEARRLLDHAADFSCLVDDLVDAGELELATKFNLLLPYDRWPTYDWLSTDMIRSHREHKRSEPLRGCYDAVQLEPQPLLQNDKN